MLGVVCFCHCIFFIVTSLTTVYSFTVSACFRELLNTGAHFELYGALLPMGRGTILLTPFTLSKRSVIGEELQGLALMFSLLEPHECTFEF